MDWLGWLTWGFVATLVLTTVMTLGLHMGMTRMNIPYLLGTMFTPSRDRATIIGIVMHVMFGWMFAGMYIAIFIAAGGASWWLGALLGALHAAFLLIVGMTALPGMHPRMASEREGPTVTPQLEPPGFLGLNYGVQTPIGATIAHVIFGIVLGTLYGI